MLVTFDGGPAFRLYFLGADADLPPPVASTHQKKFFPPVSHSLPTAHDPFVSCALNLF